MTNDDNDDGRAASGPTPSPPASTQSREETRCRSPRLFILKLHESPILANNNYERFSMPWILDTDGGTADNDSSQQQQQQQQRELLTTIDCEIKLQHGDLVYIPELQSGAGEMEGVRFVVDIVQGGGSASATTTKNDGEGTGTAQGQQSSKSVLELVSAGIEAPEFPQALVDELDDGGHHHKKKSPLELRQDYEGLLNIILQQQHCSLADLFGGASVVDEYWANPTITKKSRRRGRTSDGDEEQERWHIPLDKCTILSAHAP